MIRYWIINIKQNNSLDLNAIQKPTGLGEYLHIYKQTTNYIPWLYTGHHMSGRAFNIANKYFMCASFIGEKQLFMLGGAGTSA